MEQLETAPSGGVTQTDPGGIPRRLRHGPPITIKCDCGEKRDLKYGDRWQCEKCGRVWNTNQIPVAQYKGIVDAQWRYRSVPLAITVVLVIVAVVLIVTGRALAAILVVPMVLFGYGSFVRPRRRRRRLAEIKELPRWKIKPE
jgi:hypothetical protein